MKIRPEVSAGRAVDLTLSVFQMGNERKPLMAPATLGLGIAIFALFFGLVAACDRI
jgi:hypothetical protein